MVDKGRIVEEDGHFIADLQDDIQNIVASLREIILDSSPKLKEEFKMLTV